MRAYRTIKGIEFNEKSIEHLKKTLRAAIDYAESQECQREGDEESAQEDVEQIQAFIDAIQDASVSDDEVWKMRTAFDSAYSELIGESIEGID